MSTMTKLPKAFRRINLELAREPGHPSGDPDERYVLIAPLDDEGQIDTAVWRDNREACRVVREHEGETAVGHLVRGPGGAWSLHYDVSGRAEDERVFHLSEERIRAGEYISIIRNDGAHPFRVTAVADI
jgi:hypothetical protein